MGDFKTDEGGKKVAPVDELTGKTPDKGKQAGDGAPDAKTFGGKFKSPEELEKAYTDLEKKFGEQGKELGGLRKNQALMTDELTKYRTSAEKKAGGGEKKEPKTDYEANLNKIYQDLEAGDISVLEAIKQSNALTAEIATAQALNAASRRTQELLVDKDAETAEKQFLKDHPDYEELVQSGKLQPYIDKNPLLVDETIAYFQYKATEAFEKGREESERLAKAGTIADQVLKEPGGTSVQRIPTRQKPLTEAELEAKQSETINKMRGIA